MESFFNSDFFAGNRQRLRELFTGTAPIVVAANGRLQRGGDTTYAFAQDASFWYLTGIDEPDIVLVIDRYKEYLIMPERSDVQEIFDGTTADEQLMKRSGIKRIYKSKDGWKELQSRLGKVKHAATLAALPNYVERHGFYSNPARAALVSSLKSQNNSLELLDIGPHIARLRMIKQPAELKALQAAIDITVDSIKESLRPAKLAKFRHEYQLEAELTRSFRARGAAGHAFAPIVASGKNACTLHNVANSGNLNSGELVVVDVGAEVEHYAADITRTAIYGKPSRRQLAVHAAVLEVQRFAFDCLKPGILLKDYEQQIEHFMGEKLRALNLIKTIDHHKVRRFYPHATSHFLGLNAHDVGDYDRPLEPGVVMTVEPGIYIPAESIGVRIEDGVLITDHGIEILSDKLPRTLV
jgi:Xaa-Pro aminopeptidase